MLMARDTAQDEAQKLHRKWLKHQTFMAELAQNKEWLKKIEKEGQELILEKPELSSVVQQKLKEIRKCWDDLESNTQAKAQQLFENNKGDLRQSYTNVSSQLSRQDGQLYQMDYTQDLATGNKQLSKLQVSAVNSSDITGMPTQMFKSPLEGWNREIRDIHTQVASVPQRALIRDNTSEKQVVVEPRIVRLIEPLKERRRMLLATKEVNQLSQDLDNEILWIQERLPLAMCKEYGNSLPAVEQLLQKNQGLQRELQEHQARVEDVLNRAVLIAAMQSPETDFLRGDLEQLRQLWDSLCVETERRQMTLDTIYQAQQYYGNVAEVKAWICGQEQNLAIEDKGKDEPSTVELLKKHLAMEQTIEDYAETIGLLSQQCRQLLELDHPDSEQISKQQSQVDRLYIRLKDAVEERKSKLEQQYWLYQLNREVDELEQWIAEREVVASSHELGQNLEQVTIIQDKFTKFSSDTYALGQERVTAVNKMLDELIDFGHVDGATIAEWKDGLNEAWADLLEMMETRRQMLAASHQLHKFFADCQEVWPKIEDKKRWLRELKARQTGSSSTGTFHRLMHTFQHDIQHLVAQVRQLQESATQLRTVYAGEKAEAIARREQEIMQPWKDLLTSCEECGVQLTTVADKLNFFGMVQDLNLWLDRIIGQIDKEGNPRDLSSVEAVVKYHQNLKSDIEARNKSFLQCLELGKTLMTTRNQAAEEVREKLDMLMARQKELSEKWDKKWVELQKMQEVQQYSQEAVMAEAWLAGQEPFISRKELDSNVDETDQLIRHHQAFRKAAATWEEHFSLLRRLSTDETVKAKESKVAPTLLLGRKVFLNPQASGSTRGTPLSSLQQTIQEQMEQKHKNLPQKLPSTSVVQRLGSTVANYTPVMNWSSYRRVDIPVQAGPVEKNPEIPVEQNYAASPPPEPEVTHKPPEPLPEVSPVDTESKIMPSIMANVLVQNPGKDLFRGELTRDTRGSRSDPQMDRYRRDRERKLGRQTSSEQELKARWEELPLEVRERRHRRRLERQTSSEQEQTVGSSKKSSEQDSTKELSDKPTAPGEKRSTMAEIVEQVQEREAAQARGEGPRLTGTILDRVTRPDRPRARDRPKPRRRPRPKEPVETRRSRSAPAQSNPNITQPPTSLQPPTHTAKREGFLFRKHDVETQNTNRSWVNLYCVLSNGEIGFYKDAKNTTTPYNSEPLLNLSSCTCDVTNGYKKKKNVFGLKTDEGNEFYFHARDEEDLKGWITSITTSIAEHEEIAKWGMPQTTTSSTEDGTRKDGAKSDMASLDNNPEEREGTQIGEGLEKSEGGSSMSEKNK